MPNTKSAKKALRQSEKIRLRNRTQRSTLRSALKRAKKTAGEEDQAVAEAAFRFAIKKLDQAAAKNLLHEKTAARTKSRLSAFCKKAKEAKKD